MEGGRGTVAPDRDVKRGEIYSTLSDKKRLVFRPEDGIAPAHKSV